MRNDDDKERQLKIAKQAAEELIKELTGAEVQATESADKRGLEIRFPDKAEFTGKANSLDRILRRTRIEIAGVPIVEATQRDKVKETEAALGRLFPSAGSGYQIEENVKILYKYLQIREGNLGIHHFESDYVKEEGVDGLRYIPHRVVIYVTSPLVKQNLPEVIFKCAEVVVVGEEALQGLAAIRQLRETLHQGDFDPALFETQVAQLLQSVLEHRDAPGISLAIYSLCGAAAQKTRVQKSDEYDFTVLRSRGNEHYRYETKYLEPLYRAFGRVMAEVFVSQTPAYTDRQRQDVMNFLCKHKIGCTRTETLFIAQLQEGITNHFRDSQSRDSKTRFRCEVMARKWYREYLEEERRQIEEANSPSYGW